MENEFRKPSLLTTPIKEDIAIGFLVINASVFTHFALIIYFSLKCTTFIKNRLIWLRYRLQIAFPSQIQSRTKLLEKVFPIMSTFLRNKTISKTTPLREENPFPRFNVASHKRPGIRLSFEYITLLSGEGGEGRTGTATIFRKMLSKYTSFSTVLSKIVYIVANHTKFSV